MKIPHRTPFFLPWLYRSLTWRVPTSQRELFLTFDDGPLPGPTDFVLSQLKAAAAKATFFCIGDNIRKHSNIFAEIVAQGHCAGNHTFNHLNGWKTHEETYKENIEKCNEQFVKSGISAPSLFRPPYGRITRKQIRLLTEYRIIMWDVLSGDYKRSISPEKCLRNTIAATRPGSIIVFHDSLKAERNLMYTLPRFIEHFAERGFVFKSL